MSSTIDRKVVEMRFDNSDFEKNVSITLNSLKQLQNSLNMTESCKSLKSLESTVNGIDVSGLNGAISTIESRFSNLGIIGMTVIQNLTNTAINSATKVLSAVVSAIKQGGITRATNIENAKFQLAGLGIVMPEFTKQFNDQTKDRGSEPVPVEITIYKDKSFTFGMNVAVMFPMTHIYRGKYFVFRFHLNVG